MPSSDPADNALIMQGIHVELTEAMQTAIRDRFAVLFRHNPWIVRIHVRLHKDQQLGNESHYVAMGRIEIGGPDLIATVDGKAAYDVLDALVDKLDWLLHRRHGRRKDKRNHPHPVELENPLPKTEHP